VTVNNTEEKREQHKESLSSLWYDILCYAKN